MFKDSRSKTKVPEIPATGCGYLYCRGKNTGNWCNKSTLEDTNRCKEHNKKEEEPTGCSYKIREFDNIAIYCNKEKLEDIDFCQKHVPKESKVCIQCNLEKKIELFAKNRNSCLACRNARNKASSQKIKTENIFKKCKDCNETIEIVKFDGCNLACNSCRYKKSLRKSIPKLQVKEKFKETQKTCIICNETKSTIENFSIHTNTYRNQCKKCINTFKYYENYRNKKMEEDPENFRKHNAEIQKLWRENNKESYDAYIKIYNKNENYIISYYISTAKVKNIMPQNVNIKDFKKMISELIVKNCFYCDKEAKIGSLRDMIAGEYNGVDRIDSKIGYYPENCVTCCRTCNMMKNTLDVGSFIRKCFEISNNLELNRQILEDFLDIHKDKELVGNSSNYHSYYKRSETKLDTLEMSKEEFKDFVKRNCYLCGKNNKNGIGIDRVVNKIGYTNENCKPCCSYCNYMKRDYNLEIFIEKVRDIVKHACENPEVLLEMCKSSKMNKSIISNK